MSACKGAFATVTTSTRPEEGPEEGPEGESLAVSVPTAHSIEAGVADMPIKSENECGQGRVRCAHHQH